MLGCTLTESLCAAGARCWPALCCRIFTTLAFCSAAFSIHVSALVLTAVSVVEPNRKENVKKAFISHLGRLITCGLGSLLLSGVAMFLAIALAPFSVLYVKRDSALDVDSVFSAVAPSAIIVAVTIFAFFVVTCEAGSKLFQGGAGKHAACCAMIQWYTKQV